MENKISGSAINILIKYLEDLKKDDLHKYNVLLKNYPVKRGYSPIPKAQLENANVFTIADQMIDNFKEEYALEIAGDLLNAIPRRDLYDQFKCDSQKYLDNNAKLQGTRVHKRDYMGSIEEQFRTFQDKNGRIGENISLKKRYTKLLIIKEYRLQAEREHEIMTSGWKHLKIMAQQAKHSYSSIAAFFDPDEEGHVPRTVVLQGAAGIGKTMTARKIMLDWASGELFQDRFDYLFYINCREINQLSPQQTIAELLSHSCPGMSLPMREIEADPGKLLFIIDGFDELNISIDLLTGDLSKETQKDNTVMRLIRKTILFKCYIIITTRPTALEKLSKCVVAPRFAEILGFSEDDRKEYFIKFFKNEKEGGEAFNIVKENDLLFTMCFVPIVCWIVCTVIKQRMVENKDPGHALKTTTSVYMSFLFNLLKQQSSDSVQPIHRNLQRLCALAKEGVWQQKILFEEEDLIKHCLAVPAIQSLFLINDIFLKDTECENYYSFIHLTFQEFFAAMFYVLRENEASQGLWHYIEQMIKSITSNQTECAENPQRDVVTLLEASRTQKHFLLTVLFLFGLHNQEALNQMGNKFKWKISLDIKPALLEWIKEEIKQDFSKINNEQMGLFHCLYEIQDEDFVKSGTEHLKRIGVSKHSLLREMTAMDFRALGFCLKNSPGVEKVNISDIEIKPKDLSALIPGLMKCSSLRMDHCSLALSFCADLFSVLRKNTSLTELSFNGNKLMDSGVKELCEGLEHSGCKIQNLWMLNCSLTGACCADLASVLRTNTSLTELDLSRNKLMDSGVRELCEGLKHPGCKIQKLVMLSCSLSGLCCAALSSVLRTNTSLTELHLSRNKLKDSGVRELCEGLKHRGCKIQKVVMLKCGLTGSCCADLSSVVRTNTSLTELDLSENELMDSGVRELCEGLKLPACKIQKLVMLKCGLTGSCCADLSSVVRTNTSLIELDLGGNELMDSEVRELCEGLKHPGCKIQKLVMDTCSLPASCCADLSSVVKTSTSLIELDLSENELTDSGVRELCEGLKHPGCKIQKLMLWHCSLTGSCCADLSYVVRINTSLTELNVSFNTLGDSGLIELCEGLNHPGCKIQTLLLHRTELTDACTEALCAVLRTAQSLQRLELLMNHFTERSTAAFKEFKESSKSLEVE